MASVIDDLLTELSEARNTLLPQREGFDDLARALSRDTASDYRDAQASAVAASKELADRIASIERSEDALRTLKDNGYPVPQVFVLPNSTIAALTEQQTTITAALATVKRSEVAAADVMIGDPVLRV